MYSHSNKFIKKHIEMVCVFFGFHSCLSSRCFSCKYKTATEHPAPACFYYLFEQNSFFFVAAASSSRHSKHTEKGLLLIACLALCCGEKNSRNLSNIVIIIELKNIRNSYVIWNLVLMNRQTS